MYYSNFYLSFWLFLAGLLAPFVALAAMAIVLEKIKEYLDEQKKRDKMFSNINFLIAELKKDPERDELNEIIDAFMKNFASFANLQKESKDYQNRLDFLNAFVWCNSIDIDSIVQYREKITGLNPNFKKEIETVIGSAIKARESEKKKKN